MLPEEGDGLFPGIEAGGGVGLVGASVDGRRIGRDEVRKKRSVPRVFVADVFDLAGKTVDVSDDIFE